MTDREPEVAPFRKIRVRPSFVPVPMGENRYRTAAEQRLYWRTHIVVTGPDDDPTFSAAEDELDAWIARRNGNG